MTREEEEEEDRIGQRMNIGDAFPHRLHVGHDYLYLVLCAFILEYEDILFTSEPLSNKIFGNQSLRQLEIKRNYRRVMRRPGLETSMQTWTL